MGSAVLDAGVEALGWASGSLDGALGRRGGQLGSRGAQMIN